MILIEKSRLNLIGAYGALGLAVFLLQTTLLSGWRILQVTPVMTVAAVVCVAVFEGEVTGGLFGLFLGLALDATVSTNSGAAALSLLLVGALVVSWDNFGFQESFAASLTCISNVGPGLGILGPMENFSILSPLSKIALSLEMLTGRLELMPMLALLTRGAWRDR